MSLVGERVSETLIDGLPNLKIEIENDLDQRMETDDDDASSVGKAPSASSETEEGEVIDEDEDQTKQQRLRKASSSISVLNSQMVPTGRSILKYDTREFVELQQTNAVQNPKGAFVTGVNVFSPEEQAKLDKRAQRFGIEASEAKVLTERLLKKLYKSMCVKPTDKNIRVDALHMRGTDNMSTQDVFTYFKDYGPASLEWISDNSCNVVWLDDISAARALLGLSVHISGQTAPATQPERRQSLSDSDVDMETQVNRLGPKESTEDAENLSEESDAVPLNDLEVKLPPGRWRRGAPHPLAACILLRFATTSDRSLPRPGFTKYGSHQSGGYVGLISESRKRRLQNALPVPLLFEDVGDEVIPKPSLDETDNANPWGTLAKTWSQFDKVRKPRPPSPKIERILPLPPRMTPPPSPPMFMSSRNKLVARRRMRRVSDVEEDGSDTEEWRSRSKMPRMRMHADDEERKQEKRLKRVQRNRSLSLSPTRPRDLRHKLGIVVHRHSSDVEHTPDPEPASVTANDEEDDEVPDLRVAVPAERSSSPEDSKAGIRQSLFLTGNVKSVLRGARGYSENEEEEEDENEDKESEESAKVRSSGRRHRSRSKERRKHHRKHKKESSHHKSRRVEERDDSDDSCEQTGKIKSTIRRKSPDVKERVRSGSREQKSPRTRRRRKEDDYKRSDDRKSDNRERRRHGESRSGKDLRSKLAHRGKIYDGNNEFRSKSPLQIEIDNDEYYRESKSD